MCLLFDSNWKLSTNYSFTSHQHLEVAVNIINIRPSSPHSPVISVFLGFISEPIIDMISCPPWGRALATSRSCNVTSCTISFFLCTSPLGKGTYSSASKSNSVAYVSDLPCLWKGYNIIFTNWPYVCVGFYYLELCPLLYQPHTSKQVSHTFSCGPKNSLITSFTVIDYYKEWDILNLKMIVSSYQSQPFLQCLF